MAPPQKHAWPVQGSSDRYRLLPEVLVQQLLQLPDLLGQLLELRLLFGWNGTERRASVTTRQGLDPAGPSARRERADALPGLPALGSRGDCLPSATPPGDRSPPSSSSLTEARLSQPLPQEGLSTVSERRCEL